MDFVENIGVEKVSILKKYFDFICNYCYFEVNLFF